MNYLWDILKSILWIVVEFLLFVIILAPISYLINFVINAAIDIPDNISLADNPVYTLLNEYIPLLIGSLFSLYLTHVVIFKRPWAITGFSRGRKWPDTLMAGFMAALFISLGFGLLYILRYIIVDTVDFDFLLFGGFILLFFVQSSFEEIVSRSFMIPSITARSNIWVALFISSSLFAILHLTNPSISLTSTINIFLAGLVLGLLYLRYQSIWPAISFHAAWNFFQGSFYGFEVSGHEVYSYIDSTENGPDWLTGGSFGFEGSLMTTLLLLSYSIYLYDKWDKKVIPGQLL